MGNSEVTSCYTLGHREESSSWTSITILSLGGLFFSVLVSLGESIR
jgi:hypothetical protein